MGEYGGVNLLQQPRHSSTILFVARCSLISWKKIDKAEIKFKTGQLNKYTYI